MHTICTKSACSSHQTFLSLNGNVLGSIDPIHLDKNSSLRESERVDRVMVYLYYNRFRRRNRIWNYNFLFVLFQATERHHHRCGICSQKNLETERSWKLNSGHKYHTKVNIDPARETVEYCTAKLKGDREERWQNYWSIEMQRILLVCL